VLLAVQRRVALGIGYVVRAFRRQGCFLCYVSTVSPLSAERALPSDGLALLDPVKQQQAQAFCSPPPAAAYTRPRWWNARREG